MTTVTKRQASSPGWPQIVKDKNFARDGTAAAEGGNANMALCCRAPPLADSIERLCRSRQSGEWLSLRREAAEVERPDSSEVGESIEEDLFAAINAVSILAFRD